jgi:hypothetical protein
VLGGVDFGEVLVAALGDEIGLGHHRYPQVDEVGYAVGGHHGRVFDAAVSVRAGLAQRRDGHDKLRGGDTVVGHRAAAGVPLQDPAGELVEI